MSNYALIKGDKVMNIIAWDGPEVSPLELEKDITAVEITSDVVAGI
ncbi:hypothetical protein [Pantoea anthophila]